MTSGNLIYTKYIQNMGVHSGGKRIDIYYVAPLHVREVVSTFPQHTRFIFIHVQTYIILT